MHHGLLLLLVLHDKAPRRIALLHDASLGDAGDAAPFWFAVFAHKDQSSVQLRVVEQRDGLLCFERRAVFDQTASFRATAVLGQDCNTSL